MSVIIKNMEVPQCCGACHVGFCKQIGCELYIGFDDYATSRHPDCPISNIPTPHGRLIDADALMKEIQETCKRLYGTDDISTASPTLSVFKLYIGEAPTVIGAEE